MSRLSFSLLIVVILASVSLGWAIDRLFDEVAQSETDTVQVFQEVGKSLIRAYPEPEALKVELQRWPDSSGIQMSLLSMANLALHPSLQQQIASGEPLALESERNVSLLYAIPSSNTVLSVSFELDGNQNSLRVLMTVLFYLGFVLLLMVWIYPLARRLNSLSNAAKAFGEGDLHQRVATHKRSNLHDIESEFNSMAQRIQHLIADNRLLTSAVSHDLRTPLARLRFGVDLLEEAETEQARSKYLLRIGTDLTVMENLVEVLLEYARLDQQLSDFPVTQISLNNLVYSSVEAVNSYSNEVIQTDIDEEDFTILANTRYLTMLVNNVLQNAVNYGDGAVKVTLHARHYTLGESVKSSSSMRNAKIQKTTTSKKVSRALELTIEDNGPGIPEHLRKEVLKPFVRGQVSQQAGVSKGYGMGLAIVNRIAQWHNVGFSISQSSILGGAKFTLLFPEHHDN